MNAERTRYTGVLCGLGADDEGNAIFPEHDFEIYFDCEITFDDFTTVRLSVREFQILDRNLFSIFIQVNRLRYLMGLLLLTEEDEPLPNLSFGEIIKSQKKIQKDLIRLEFEYVFLYCTLFILF